MQVASVFAWIMRSLNGGASIHGNEVKMLAGVGACQSGVGGIPSL